MIEIIKDFKSEDGLVQKGWVLKARALRTSLVDVNPRIQIVGGKYSGVFVPRECCIEQPSEKTYTEKEWNDMENYYMKLVDDERDRANDLEEKLDSILKPLMKYIEQASISIQVAEMLEEWLETSYEGSEEVDRKNFSLKLTKFIQEKLV